jgi:molybdopterin-guanine dinucleotide biosynthesis protein A
MRQDLPPTSGIILAGGRSTRLGQDKALLALPDGRSLIAHVVARLAPLVAEVVVVATDAERLGPLPARLVPDVFPGGGALGGIYAGLDAAREEHSLVVACDMPLLSLPLLRHLLAKPRDFDVLMPRLSDDQVEPLHALYSKACLEQIRRQLVAGHHRIISFLGDVRVRYVEEAELRRLDPELRSFFNVNTPADLAALPRLLQEAG